MRNKIIGIPDVHIGTTKNIHVFEENVEYYLPYT